jgi:hypothetical protein
MVVWKPRIGPGFEGLGPGSVELSSGSTFWVEAQNWARVRGFGLWKPRIESGCEVLGPGSHPELG